MAQKRILFVDDNEDIHKDYYKILTKRVLNPLDKEEEILFGNPSLSNNPIQTFRFDSAYQGEQALELVKKSLVDGDPYALAFIDMRMPPGWDGVETIQRIWEVDPNIQMVICSAYSDHSWEDITRILGDSDNLLILKKPFEVIEIKQLAAALTNKWELLANLHQLVENRTHELENLFSVNQATLEATEEGILAVGLDGNIILFNQKFLTQWGLTEAELSFQKSDVIFEKLSKKIENPVFFLQTIHDLIAQPKSKIGKEWTQNSGKTFALFAHPQYLHDKISGMVFSFQDVTERKDLEKQLLHQATHDILTKLPNRALLQDRIKQTIRQAKRYSLKVGILLLDLDSFKEINDALGHNAGDDLLKQLAQKLNQFVRASDTVARLGGDEFVIVFAELSDEKKLVELLNSLMSDILKPYRLADREVIVSGSIGVSIYPQDGEDADMLLKNADSALYQAKELGKNRFQFYKEEFNQHILQRAELKVALSHALKNNELFLNYQPLFDLNTGKVIGIEALLRWNHPVLGNIPPLDFIPIAEESGLILPIGEWVLKTACTQMHKWNTSGTLPNIKISINISVKQFRQKNFVSLIQEVLKESLLNPKFLELEITESLILGDVADVIKKMTDLKELGVRFAIDDFGTGYSGLSYLKHFPFDTVKIDKSFMDNIATDSNNASIVEAIIGMTKNMGMDVLAEGVENTDQVNFLKKHHSNQVQGYYFSKPLSVADLNNLLENKNIYP